MIWLWRFIIGYIVIEISGENCEQILNRAAANNINFWNLKYEKGKIHGCISPKNFLKLYTLRHGLNCKIKVIKKRGYVFYIKKYKKRFGFILGFILFIAILFFLSNFVWIINVEGNYTIPTQQIIKSCKKIGIYEGISKGKINNKYDAQRLQLTQDGIAWCSLNIEGCVLTVNLSEAAVSDKEARQIPSNIKAAIEGKIKKIDITSGNAAVKVGDTVSKGDLLVSGIIENLSSTHFVHSDGIITAETKRTFSADGKYTQTVEQKVGETINRYTLDIFNIKIPLYLGNITQKHSYRCKIKNLKLFDKKIPIKIACEQYDILQNASVTYERAQLEKMLYNDIKNQVDNLNFISAQEQTREVVTTDIGILLKITYICEENIAVQDEILLNKEN